MGAAKHARVSSGHRPFCILAAALAASFAFAAVAPAPTASANEKVFRKVTAEDNEQARALLAEGDALRKAGDYEAAAKKYTRAIFYNEYLGGYAFRALCRMKLGDYDGAATDADTSMHLRRAKDRLRPDMNGLAEYVAGVCAYQKGDVTKAGEYFQKITGTVYANAPEVQRIRQEAEAKAAAERAAKEKAAREELERTMAELRASGGDAMLTGEDSWWINQDSKAVFQRVVGDMHDFAGVIWEMQLPENGRMKTLRLLSLPMHMHIEKNMKPVEDELMFFEMKAGGQLVRLFDIYLLADIDKRTADDVYADDDSLENFLKNLMMAGEPPLRLWEGEPTTLPEILKAQAQPASAWTWPGYEWGGSLLIYHMKADGAGGYTFVKGIMSGGVSLSTGDGDVAHGATTETSTGTLKRIGHL